MQNVIQVFEYQTLSVGECDFQAHQLDRLLAWQAHSSVGKQHKYFTIGREDITFKHFVGAIQVGNLTIEILPKIDAQTPQKEAHTYQKMLLQMLQICQKTTISSAQQAFLSWQSCTILDIYVALFLEEIEMLLHRGLVKKYKQQEGNLYALKGKIKFAKHLAYNAAHQERFYTTHQIYDKDNLPNQILAKALKTVAKITQNPTLKDHIVRLKLAFPEMEDVQVSAQTFQYLKPTRQQLAYQNALRLAEMILLNFSPDVQSGRQDVWAILFDMNQLFEEYITRNLFQNISEKFDVKTQIHRTFWRTSHTKLAIKPDIILASQTEPSEKIILDTKWKVPPIDKPNSQDIYQMFAYCQHFQAHKGYLVYPTAGKTRFIEGKIALSPQIQCGLLFINLLDDEGNLRRDIGTEFF